MIYAWHKEKRFGCYCTDQVQTSWKIKQLCQLLYLVHKPTVKLWQDGTHVVQVVSYVKKLRRNEGQMWKFFILSIALSTWILSDAVRLVSTKSFADNWAPCRKGGMFNATACFAQTSSIVNTLLAISESPRLISFKKPLEIVNSLSETEPPTKSERKQIAPLVVIPTRALN